MIHLQFKASTTDYVDCGGVLTTSDVHVTDAEGRTHLIAFQEYEEPVIARALFRIRCNDFIDLMHAVHGCDLHITFEEQYSA